MGRGVCNAWTPLQFNGRSTFECILSTGYLHNRDALAFLYTPALQCACLRTRTRVFESSPLSRLPLGGPLTTLIRNAPALEWCMMWMCRLRSWMPFWLGFGRSRGNCLVLLVVLDVTCCCLLMSLKYLLPRSLALFCFLNTL